MVHLIEFLLSLGARYVNKGLPSCVFCVQESLIYHLGFGAEFFTSVVSKAVNVVWVVVFITFFFFFKVCITDGLEGVVQEG